jgi:GTPase SAR1 family protein
MKISSAVTKLLNEIEQLLPNQSNEAPVFKTLFNDLSEIRNRLDEPLRVAIVGQGKAGKSTLFNAMLGEKVLYTDVLAATHTACWFKYGEKRELFIRYNDDTEEELPFDELEKWSSWKGRKEDGEYIKRKWLTIKYPSPLLKVIDIIDTAGINAATAETPEETEDVQNTLELLKSANVEAFIYAYMKVPQSVDIGILKEYNSSALNAVGVLTRVDNQLKPDDDPIKLVTDMCERHGGELKGEVYNVLPTAARIAEGAVRLDDTALLILKKLAAVENETLRGKLVNESGFLKNGIDRADITTGEREKLINLFGKNGLYLAVRAVRDGLAGEAFINHMYAKSGVDKLRERVIRHFGNHAYLLRLEFVLRRIEKHIGAVKRGNRSNNEIIRICDQMKNRLDEWQHREELLFKELSILRSYYNGGINFTSPELQEQFKEITGEYGSNCEARLGYGNRAVTVREMKNEVMRRNSGWLEILNDIGTPAGMVRAAEVVVRICNELRIHLDALAGYD